MSNQNNLLKSKRFLPLFITQFLGAMNDNVIKNAMVVLFTFNAAQWTSLDAIVITNLAAGLFILPFFLFSASAGQLADKYDKALLTRWIKILEILIVCLAFTGFLFQSFATLMTALFLLGCQSTFFGPVKYAILPQHLEEKELIGGNAFIEAGTFIAILIGTILGGSLAGLGAQSSWWISFVGIILAVVGYISSRSIPSAPPPEPTLTFEWNTFKQTWKTISLARNNQTVFLSILGISWFWLYGALLLTQFPTYAKFHLSGNESAVVLLLAVFTFGIGAGSLLCERLSKSRIELGLVPFGAIGLTLFGLDLALASPSANSLIPLFPDATTGISAWQLLSLGTVWHVLLDLFFIGLFGGFYIVPLYALVQNRGKKKEMARIISANNILNALFMVIGTIIATALLSQGLTIPMLFGVVALMNALVAIYIFTLVPEFLFRFIVWMLVRTIYRHEEKNTFNIPEEGAALLVCNHISFADALVISASIPRPIRFIMDHQIFSIPVLSFCFRYGKAIPITSAKVDPEVMEQAFETAAEALRNGDLVCIFPEGRLTRDGEIGVFRAGYLQITEKLALSGHQTNIIPMGLSGLWQSLFARRTEKGFKRLFINALFKPTRLNVGTAVNAKTSPEDLRTIVNELRGDWR